MGYIKWKISFSHQSLFCTHGVQKHGDYPSQSTWLRCASVITRPLLTPGSKDTKCIYFVNSKYALQWFRITFCQLPISAFSLTFSSQVHISSWLGMGQGPLHAIGKVAQFWYRLGKVENDHELDNLRNFTLTRGPGALCRAQEYHCNLALFFFSARKVHKLM